MQGLQLLLVEKSIAFEKDPDLDSNEMWMFAYHTIT